MSRIAQFIKTGLLVLVALNIAPLLILGIRDIAVELWHPKTKIVLLPLRDPIMNAIPLIKRLRHCMKDERTKALILLMDCPGGAASSSEMVFGELKKLRDQYKKPVITLVENSCASGAYMIACATDRIIASPSSMVGSIGVYIAQPRLNKLINRYDIEYDVIKKGDYKAAGNMFIPADPAATTMLQELCNDTYSQFTRVVSEQRPQLTLATAPTWAEGRVFTGSRGLSMGLVDEIGSFSAAEAYLCEKLSIKPAEISYVQPPRPSRIAKLLGVADDDGEDSLMESIAGTISQQSGLATGLRIWF